MFLKKRYEIDNPKSILKFSKDDRDKILEELNIQLDAVVNIAVDDSVLIDRIVGRRV